MEVILMTMKDMKTRLLLMVTVAATLVCLQGTISSGALAETRHPFRNSHKNLSKITDLIKQYKLDDKLEEIEGESPNDIIEGKEKKKEGKKQQEEVMKQQEEVERGFGFLPPIAGVGTKQYRQTPFNRTFTTFVKSIEDPKSDKPYGIEVVDGRIIGIRKVIVNEGEHYAKELSVKFEKKYGTPSEKEFFTGEQGLKRWSRQVFIYNVIHKGKCYLFKVYFSEELNPNRTLIIISLVNIEQIYSEFEEKAKADYIKWKEDADKREQTLNEAIDCLDNNCYVLPASSDKASGKPYKTPENIVKHPAEDAKTSKRFKDNGDGSVTDTLTNLVWMIKNIDYYTSPNDKKKGRPPCGRTYIDDAIKCVKEFGYGWRLPTIQELYRLCRTDGSQTGLDAILQQSSGYGFCNGKVVDRVLQLASEGAEDVQSYFYWSSTPNANDTSSRWLVRLGGGSIYTLGKFGDYDVLPVSSYEAWEKSDMEAKTIKRFKDSGDGSITDKLTKLQWMKKADACGNVKYDEAVACVGKLGGGWRLPSESELDRICSTDGYQPGKPQSGSCNHSYKSRLPSKGFEDVQSCYYFENSKKIYGMSSVSVRRFGVGSGTDSVPGENDRCYVLPVRSIR
ncbi:secreted protein containing DUF1566 [Candidatus Magnetobacterium bavaricum]|uniref:Secreted protein containing DUF1566 n=1 Tax=Candidatus Magnetobacterium bavaricum TaxID=29290 RepID=A0A0F3GLS7_9BACT|nr:secreted protein containing DUF1566 [Candidatus Magnetobacterium bavaricum]